MRIPFSKLTGSGNDFIIIDNTKNVIDVKFLKEKIHKVCARARSVGADGVIIIMPSDKAHFKWLFFNSDGSEAEMCGNGGRCAARFAYEKGMAPKELTFETLAGIISAKVFPETYEVEVELTPICGFRSEKNIKLNNGLNLDLFFINVGVPHAVIFTDDLGGVDVEYLGRKIRFHQIFLPSGTNVNFVKVVSPNVLSIRTYERGVEGETLSCGTGAVACALVYLKGKTEGKVEVRTASGEILLVRKVNNKVFLRGPTRWVYDGEMRDEAWRW